MWEREREWSRRSSTDPPPRRPSSLLEPPTKRRPLRFLPIYKQDAVVDLVESLAGDTSFQALKMYGHDLVEQSRKLEPVATRSAVSCAFPSAVDQAVVAASC